MAFSYKLSFLNLGAIIYKINIIWMKLLTILAYY